MKVLVAVDNKPSSQAIIDALIKMRWYEGTEIYVTTVRSEPASATEPPDTARHDDEEIEAVALDLHKALPVCQVFFLPVEGDPKSAILDTAKQIGADLIVIGSNCKNTLERLLIGSVCQVVLNGAHCPVIVAKTPCCLAREVSPGFRNILIPIDNSIFSDVAIAWLANFNWGPECRFILAAAVEQDTNMELVRRSLNDRAAHLANALRTNNVAVEIITGEPRQSILDLARKYYSDLIVMGSHGRTGLKKLILGNIAHAVSHEAPCAVAIVRGIAPDDNQWVDTGAFQKVKPVPIEALMMAGGGGRRDDGDLSSPHSVPSGM